MKPIKVWHTDDLGNRTQITVDPAAIISAPPPRGEWKDATPEAVAADLRGIAGACVPSVAELVDLAGALKRSLEVQPPPPAPRVIFEPRVARADFTDEQVAESRRILAAAVQVPEGILFPPAEVLDAFAAKLIDAGVDALEAQVRAQTSDAMAAGFAAHACTEVDVLGMPAGGEVEKPKKGKRTAKPKAEKPPKAPKPPRDPGAELAAATSGLVAHRWTLAAEGHEKRGEWSAAATAWATAAAASPPDQKDAPAERAIKAGAKAERQVQAYADALSAPLAPLPVDEVPPSHPSAPDERTRDLAIGSPAWANEHPAERVPLSPCIEPHPEEVDDIAADLPPPATAAQRQRWIETSKEVVRPEVEERPPSELEHMAPLGAAVPFKHDPRIPPVGTILAREYEEGLVQCQVLANGYSWHNAPPPLQGIVYPSISAVAGAATRRVHNGFVFFNLQKRGEKAPTSRKRKPKGAVADLHAAAEYQAAAAFFSLTWYAAPADGEARMAAPLPPRLSDLLALKGEGAAEVARELAAAADLLETYAAGLRRGVEMLAKGSKP